MYYIRGCKEIYSKLIKTNLEKYGVECSMQNPNTLLKQTKSSYKLNEYIMPSKKNQLSRF